MIESCRTLDCFGGAVTLRAGGVDASGFGAPAALLLAEALLRRIHAALTCFELASELSQLNADSRPVVPAGSLVRRLAGSVEPAGRLSGGLVDATVGSPGALRGAWRSVIADVRGTAVLRPPGVHIDSGGLAKGMAADLTAARLDGYRSFAVDCLGDLRVGGTARLPRAVRISDPFGAGDEVARLWLRDGAVATSGTTRRCGHLIDPRTGEAADTGIVQSTALAQTGLEAEVRAKALLAGPHDAGRHLPHGGVLVLASGEVINFTRAR